MVFNFNIYRCSMLESHGILHFITYLFIYYLFIT